MAHQNLFFLCTCHQYLKWFILWFQSRGLIWKHRVLFFSTVVTFPRKFAAAFIKSCLPWSCSNASAPKRNSIPGASFPTPTFRPPFLQHPVPSRMTQSIYPSHNKKETGICSFSLILTFLFKYWYTVILLMYPIRGQKLIPAAKALKK